jgi:hypothetical protein
MKKVGLFLILLFIFSFCGLSDNKFINLCKDFNRAKLEIFCNNYIREIENEEKFKIIKNGNSYIIQTNASMASEIKKYVNDYSGFTLSFKGTKQDALSLINDLKIVKTENINGIKSIYGYAGGFLNCVVVGGKKVNVQIAINNEMVFIGSPVILGSY